VALSPGAEVTEATLFVTVNGENTALPRDAGKQPGSISTRPAGEPFPPYARIAYRGSSSTPRASKKTTNETHFLYDDNRFRWQTLEKDGVTLNWVSGDKALMVNGWTLR
jgi:hypothetical protein